MKSRKVFTVLLGLGSIALIGNLIYRFSMGLPVGFTELLISSLFLFYFLFTITWGSRKKKKDGILPSEELGKEIEKRSASLSYSILVGILFIGLIIEGIATGTVNVSLMVIFGLALVLPALLSYILAQTYQIKPNIVGRAANWISEVNTNISQKAKRRLSWISAFLMGLFIIPPLFDESRGFNDLLVYLFGESGNGNFNPFPYLFTAVIIALLSYGIYQIEARSKEGSNEEN
ncbi:hypothetical protein DHX103_06855 [Planococcus sp. X10-3]|uniref:hypothetical protein n=1 Tax=Planococcus sp. X10-3 TaxID=3061240 RepID=UPI003BB1BB4B